MLPLSAIDAIGPAWSHTRRLLWDNRSWRTLLKIGVVASFAGSVSGVNLNFPGFNNFPGNTSGTGHTGPMISHAAIAAILSLALVIGIAIVLLGLIFLYISARLQFVMFEVVLRSDTTIGPIWRRYSSRTWRWIGLRLMVGLAFLAILAPLLIPLIMQIVRTVHASPDNGSINVMALFAAMFGTIVLIFLLALLSAIVARLLHDFGLPSMALEDTPISLTVSRVWLLVRSEPGQIALYVLMHFVLGIAGAIVANIVIAILALVSLIPLGAGGAVIWLVLRNTGLGGHILMITALVLLGLVFLAVVLVAAFMATGYLGTFLQAYALYFLGGRYPLLGQYLAPYWPQTHLPVPPPPAYQPPPSAPPAPPAFEPPTA